MPLPTVLGWKLFYGDGSTYSSKQGAWEDAPAVGVQVVNVYFEGGFVLRHWGFDTFYRVETPAGVVISGYYPENPVPHPASTGKRGPTLSAEAFRGILRRAVAEGDWGTA